jgi:hypothetical protein
MTRRSLACVALVLLVGAGRGSAETVVTWNVLSDEVWTVAGSPYIIWGAGVSNAVRVKNGSTLTIEPGVEVRFEDGRFIEMDAGGSIVAIGAPGDSILFTSNSTTPSEAIWTSVSVFQSTESSFEHCVFLYARYGLYVSTSNPVPPIPISHCSFRRCEYGIYCARSSPAITACEVTACTSAGILCWGNESQPTIYYCNLYGNTPRNVRLANYVAPLVTIMAEFNWWGTTTPSAIGASIWDNLDEPSIQGLVDYDPPLPSAPVEQMSWCRIKALFAE